MRRFALLGMLLAITVSPAAAQTWQMENASDAQGKLYVAFVVDATDTIEVQFTCDELLDGKVFMSVFTAEDYGASKKRLAQTPITIAVDGRDLPPLPSVVSNIDDELVLDVHEGEVPALRSALTEVAAAEDGIVISYADSRWTVSRDGARKALAAIERNCPASEG
jgi:hypothetical protein